MPWWTAKIGTLLPCVTACWGRLQRRRSLGNRLVHEYFERPDELAPALERACRFTQRMHTDYLSLREYALTLLDIDPPGYTP